jgi:TonB family protein
MATLAVTAARRYDAPVDKNYKVASVMTRQRIKLIGQFAMAAFVALVVFDRPAKVQGAALDKVELPAYRGTLRDDYYPDDARQHYLQGRALVEFSINGNGVPTDVTLVASEPPREFEKSARLLVRNLRFEVPSGWQASAAAAQRFRLGVRFQVVECLNFSHCETDSHNPPPDYADANRTYVVSAQRRVLTFKTGTPGQPQPQYPVEPQYQPQGSQPAGAAPAPMPAYPQRPPQNAAPAPGETIYPPG